jgi:catechol 2,3-dioxygenase-like lactoylglutathione lyase family enzyme
VPKPFLSYTGIRVTDLDRSLRFYRDLFGLEEVSRGDDTQSGKGPYVLLRDPFSGQKLELNYYAPDSRFATRYDPGEGLDHIAFRVDGLDDFLSELHRAGVRDAPGSPNHTLPSGHRVVYVLDPDGNWVEIYEHPEEHLRTPPPGY